MYSAGTGADGSDKDAVTGPSYAAWGIASWIVFAMCLARTGATPGKRRCGLAVVTRDGRSLSPLRVAARVAVTTAGICLAGFGLLMIPFSRGHRGLADFVTDTEVVAGAIATRRRER